jgi:hypothetical protein
MLEHAKRDLTGRYAGHQRVEVLRKWLDRLPWLSQAVRTKGREGLS